VYSSAPFKRKIKHVVERPKMPSNSQLFGSGWEFSAFVPGTTIEPIHKRDRHIQATDHEREYSFVSQKSCFSFECKDKTLNILNIYIYVYGV